MRTLEEAFEAGYFAGFQNGKSEAVDRWDRFGPVGVLRWLAEHADPAARPVAGRLLAELEAALVSDGSTGCGDCSHGLGRHPVDGRCFDCSCVGWVPVPVASPQPIQGSA
jgi:hypothetical protein